MSTDHNDFSQGSIPKTITRLAIPLIGAQLINALYNIVDRIYIGRMQDIGELALTGVGVTFPFILIISAFAQLAGMGGAPLASIARGAGDKERAERIMGNSFSLLMVMGIVLTAVCLLVKEPSLYLFGASDQTYQYADQYLTIYTLGSIFVMITLGMNSFISIQGFARVSMMTVLIGAVVNIVLDPLFIFVFKMGVAGAALATVISQMISAVWIMTFLLGNRCILKLKPSCLRPDFSLIRRIVALGLSSFVMAVNDSLVAIVCNASLKHYGGDVYVGAMTVVSSVRQILTMPLSGFGQAAVPVLSFNFGAKRYDRVRQAAKFTMLVVMGFSTFAWAIAMSIPATLIRLFTDDPALLAVGVSACRQYFALFFLMGLQMSTQRCYVSMGKAKQAIFFSLLRKAFVVVPMTLILPLLFGLGASGVFLAEPVSDFIGPVACFVTFMLVEWPKLKVNPVL